MGPSMSDAVNSIDTSALGTPGCASFVYTQRSYEPFIRDGFDQFSETSSGGAFTFMTGIGGFLQEFLYGYSGMRFGPGAVSLAPSLTSQLGGVVLHDLAWRGRVFTVAIGRRQTTVTLTAGAPLTLRRPGGSAVARRGHPVTLSTARPDLTATADRVRCAAATAYSAAPGAPALAAIDGSAGTAWQPVALPATLTVAVGGRRPVGQAVLVWGRQWPAHPTPNVHPAPGPVLDRRATRYDLLTSVDGRHWHRVVTVRFQHGTTDTIRFTPTRVRYIRIRLVTAGRRKPPMLQELTVS
jgi:glycosyl hydrolase family 65/F5/8 type C domain-containing protein